MTPEKKTKRSLHFLLWVYTWAGGFLHGVHLCAPRQWVRTPASASAASEMQDPCWTRILSDKRPPKCTFPGLRGLGKSSEQYFR